MGPSLRTELSICVALIQAFAVVSLSREAMAQEGGFRWQAVTSSERSSLILARPSDFVTGRFEFSCVRGSGTVEVAVSMKDEQRASFAELVKSGAYPEITLPGESDSSGLMIDSLKFAHHGGWMYSFRVEEDSKWIADFQSTGTVRLSVGKTIKDSEGLKAGLDAIGEFRNQCRKAPRSAPRPSQLSLPWTRPNPNVFPPPKAIPNLPE